MGTKTYNLAHFLKLKHLLGKRMRFVSLYLTWRYSFEGFRRLLGGYRLYIWLSLRSISSCPTLISKWDKALRPSKANRDSECGILIFSASLLVCITLSMINIYLKSSVKEESERVLSFSEEAPPPGKGCFPSPLPHSHLSPDHKATLSQTAH